MRIKNIFGKEVSKSFSKYKIDWDRKVSKPQKRVKDIIRPYWAAQDVYEELYIPNSKLRIDLINFSVGKCIEVSPKQHQEYNEFLHGSRLKYLEAQKRDLQKIDWCEMNGFDYVEIDESDLKQDDEFILAKILDC
jgi:hypothetical protein